MRGNARYDRQPEPSDRRRFARKVAQPAGFARAAVPHLSLRACAAVAGGGLLGGLARYGVGLLLRTPAGGWPTATFVVNMVGAFLLGLVVEALARTGPDEGWHQQVRLFAATGFCGALTTYSALALETDQLARHHHAALTVAYPVVSLTCGLMAAAGGLAVASVSRPGAPAAQVALPVDPDLPEEDVEQVDRS